LFEALELIPIGFETNTKEADVQFMGHVCIVVWANIGPGFIPGLPDLAFLCPGLIFS
jgi:hypothetical protein